MDNTRQQKIARQIQRDVAEILQKDAADLVRGSLVTVTAVRISPDLAYSKRSEEHTSELQSQR